MAPTDWNTMKTWTKAFMDGKGWEGLAFTAWLQVIFSIRRWAVKPVKGWVCDEPLMLIQFRLLAIFSDDWPVNLLIINSFDSQSELDFSVEGIRISLFYLSLWYILFNVLPSLCYKYLLLLP
jgi:hypothetical protein